MKTPDHVFSWSWATPIFVALAGTCLYLTWKPNAFGAMAFAFAFSYWTGKLRAVSLNRARLASVFFLSAITVTVIAITRIEPLVWRERMIFPTFAFVLASAIAGYGEKP